MTRDDYAKMVRELLDVDEGMTDWEVNFLESISRRPAGSWSQAVLAKIEQIWRTVFG